MQVILIPENIEAEIVCEKDDGIVVKYPIDIDGKMIDKYEYRVNGSYKEPGENETVTKPNPKDFYVNGELDRSAYSKALSAWRIAQKEGN